MDWMPWLGFGEDWIAWTIEESIGPRFAKLELSMKFLGRLGERYLGRISFREAVQRAFAVLESQNKYIKGNSKDPRLALGMDPAENCKELETRMAPTNGYSR